MVVDHSSFANTEQIAVRHADLELDIHFSSKTISGVVRLQAEALQDTSELVIDTRDLQLHGASHLLCGSQASTPFHLDQSHQALGSKCSIALPHLRAGARITVHIEFTTSPSSSAIQFLAPEQTAGGKHPYLFTQCQAIHARSFVPCQDTPGAKMTYKAAVRVPAPLVALMSALQTDAQSFGQTPYLDTKPRPDAATYYFEQPVPIPSYLLALAVGELESREVGPITRVWSEPSMVDAGAHEFADTQRFLDIGVELAGEYVWGRYDLLLMPPSFPYGGMENPCLTFVTPTLLAGDRSLANVVAHEVAHSWTGNLITNATWEHFWLNEGFTVLLERKIIGRMEGEQALQFASYLGYNELKETVAKIGPDHTFTALIPDLSGGIDPDDAFSKVPYEKGSYFLYYLQGLVGGPRPFEAFLKAYVQAHRFSVHTSDSMRSFFLDFFKDVPAVQQVDWETWFHRPGLPTVRNSYDTSLGRAAFDLADRWHSSEGASTSGSFETTDLKGWSTSQTTAFLAHLLQLSAGSAPLKPATTRHMAAVYRLDESHNSEIRALWYRLCLSAGDEAALPLTAAFLKEQGRMKFLRPLYQVLCRSEKGRQVAVQTFESARGTYHPIAAKMVASDLKAKQ
ncbi:hypothetical protein WJX73_000383 [Symbiochloris irregularis]|uniref:Leucine aminopeptidase n=1 Tax=Symbiochloris irregularis TaxID=706552 RepID=A0AAW1NYW2_9CHLO